MADKKNIKRRLKGIVVGNKMDKTIVVEIVRKKLHSKYKKQYKSSKKYKVHDEKNTAQIGSQVSFEECRPISKDKVWRLVNIIK